MTSMPGDIGARLRALRRQEGLTLASLAYALDIDPGRLEAIEEGRTPLIARELWSFENRFGLSGLLARS